VTKRTTACVEKEKKNCLLEGYAKSAEYTVPCSTQLPRFPQQNTVYHLGEQERQRYAVSKKKKEMGLREVGSCREE